MNLYAFDVDDTLNIPTGTPAGPIPLDDLRALHAQGHIVGICGSWHKLVQADPSWFRYVSFTGPYMVSKEYVQYKADMLKQLKMWVRAQAYYLIGNPFRGNVMVADDHAAQTAGYTFVDADKWGML